MTEIPKAYDPSRVEEEWYQRWEKAGCFEGRVDNDRESYCVVIPPPNVTGVLTMGHVLNNSIQDVLVRRARQEGKSTVWIPGTDHAGIATQTRVERELRQRGKTRHDLGREAFLEEAVRWRDRHGGVILEQLRRLGCSCDWKRTVHTLDPDYSRAVIAAFVELFERGYIYRGKRMVNWCPVSQTALSDEEVIMKPQQSKLYQMRYEVVGEPGVFLEIATTRPETLMGDSAVAVHPEDERYRKYIGGKVWRPFPREEIPVVADNALDMTFGTGVLKVTPAHDPLDFEIGQRHGLEVIEVIDATGHLTARAGDEFTGMERFEARRRAVEKLRDLNLLVKEEDYQNSVGFSERADVPIEPRLSEQWFLKYPRVEEAKQVVREGMIRFHPERWEKTYLHWLDGIKDWCISRQLWWGHRIPVWYRKGEDRSDPRHWHISADGPPDADQWEQDEDVLDTWASSWLWPIGVLGWPDREAMEARGFDHFYPTAALVTGPDIIFFWVARMIMAGLELGGAPGQDLDAREMAKRIPFTDVCFNGIIRDGQGRKMSKSLGNSPDPVELIDRYGADGLRFGILGIAPQGQDIRFSEERIEQGRNFCNKLWNATRFRQISGPASAHRNLRGLLQALSSQNLDAEDHAVLFQLRETSKSLRETLAAFQFQAAIHHLYTFFWSDYCDWYLEVSKVRLQRDEPDCGCLLVQDLVLRELLLMLHPFIPFITEELWQGLGMAGEGGFVGDQAPSTAEEWEAALADAGLVLDPGAVEQIHQLRESITAIRAVKAEYRMHTVRDLVVSFLPESPEAATLVTENEEKIHRLAGLGSIAMVAGEMEGMAPVVTPIGTFYLDLASALDVGAERERISRELERLEKVIAGTEKRLANASFISKAPPEVVEGARRQLEENRDKLAEMVRIRDKLLG